MKKVILDTDIGSNIDDAICLAYLLLNPECELIGITTVSAQPEKRAMVARYISEKINRDIPVLPGMGESLIGQQDSRLPEQFEYLEKIGYSKSFETDWFNFLRNKIKENTGEINLITTGPLTNPGILFKIDKEIPLLLKSMYIMGGAFFDTTKRIEWNISCDPYAANVVFSSSVKNIYVCGLDVTTQVTMEKDRIVKKFGKNALLKEVLNFAEIWFRDKKTITFHDPLTASVLFNPDICAFKKGKIFVDQIGRTGFIEDEKHNTSVAFKVDTELFFSHFFRVIQG
ncbi:MAG TPA: nucleoside hydrolase [bacterium]|nr:nucleoside hydrolase [bacterium]